jgi:hypothetical protein
MLGNSEIGELVHFQVIGDILHVFRLSQHGAYVFLRLPEKIKTKIKTSNTHTHTHTPSFSSKLFDLVRFSTKSSSANPQIEKQKKQHAHLVSLPTLLNFLHQIKLHKPSPHTQNKRRIANKTL